MSLNKYFKLGYLLASLIIISHSAYSQSPRMPEIKAESNYKGAETHTINNKEAPPEVRLIGYNFEIKLHIKFHDDTTFVDSLYGLVCVLQDGTSLKLLINPNNVIKTSERVYEYHFPIQMKKESWLQLFLSQKTDFEEDTDTRLYRNTSNRVSIYLTPGWFKVN